MLVSFDYPDSNFSMSFVLQKRKSSFVMNKYIWEGFQWLEILWLTAENEARYGSKSGKLDTTVWSKNFSEVIFRRVTIYTLAWTAVPHAFLSILQGYASKSTTITKLRKLLTSSVLVDDINKIICRISCIAFSAVNNEVLVQRKGTKFQLFFQLHQLQNNATSKSESIILQLEKFAQLLANLVRQVIDVPPKLKFLEPDHSMLIDRPQLSRPIRRCQIYKLTLDPFYVICF